MDKYSRATSLFASLKIIGFKFQYLQILDEVQFDSEWIIPDKI